MISLPVFYFCLCFFLFCFVMLKLLICPQLSPWPQPKGVNSGIERPEDSHWEVGVCVVISTANWSVTTSLAHVNPARFLFIYFQKRKKQDPNSATFSLIDRLLFKGCHSFRECCVWGTPTHCLRNQTAGPLPVSFETPVTFLLTKPRVSAAFCP